MIRKELREWRERDDFALLTVSLDMPNTIDKARTLIRQEHVTYPVLWFGPTADDWGTCDWEVHAVPTCFLIDPQGTIVSTFNFADGLSEKLHYYVDERGIQPPLSMAMWGVKNADGSLSFELRVTNPTHQPLDVKLNLARNVLEHWETIDGKFQRVDNPPPGAEMNMSNIQLLDDYSGVRQLTFDEFGEARLKFTIPAVEPCWMISYSAEIVQPGSEQLNGSQGITVSASGYLRMEEEEPQG